LDTFYEGTKDGGSVVDTISASFKKHPEVWNDDTMKKNAINVFLRIGTNSI